MNKKNSLICFPYAGAGASIFNSWRISEDINLVIKPIQLPGREQKFIEDPYRNITDAVNGLFDEVNQIVQESDHVYVFGHSMGAVLAYEMMRKFNSEDKKITLVLSGSPSPSEMRTEKATGLPDDEFIDQVVKFAGASHEALEDEDMREFLLPILRADVEMHESYQGENLSPNDHQLILVRGVDDELVSRPHLEKWQEYTNLPITIWEIEGGHMYFSQDPNKITNKIIDLV